MERSERGLGCVDSPCFGRPITVLIGELLFPVRKPGIWVDRLPNGELAVDVAVKKAIWLADYVPGT